MNALLAIPTGGAPAPAFIASLRDLEMPTDINAFDQLTIAGNFVPGQRELAVRRALNTNADVLFMFDDDMVLPPHTLTALIEALAGDAQLAVVGALYYSRDGFRPMVADDWHSADTTTAAIPAFDRALTYCDVVGFGCVVIRMSALRTMPPPYFNAQVFVEDQSARVRICNEDYLFCEDVRRAGWTVALQAGLRCKHYDRTSNLEYPLDWEDPVLTGRRRMSVAGPGGAYRLVPYDATQARAAERHAVASIDYIIVDEKRPAAQAARKLL